MYQKKNGSSTTDKMVKKVLNQSGSKIWYLFQALQTISEHNDMFFFQTTKNKIVKTEKKMMLRHFRK